ncbi:MAG: hypothetical protein QF376_04615 [Anaerolineales bacterium]|jgi:hypothetical protein|nr:hypothetical protein [Anaerolineales bacterium]
MTVNTLLPFLSTAMMLVFCVMVLRRFFVRRSLHFLFWGIGLLMFSIASFAEAYLTLAWNRWAFFSWYFFGAALNAAWIGQGTLYLLFSRRRVLLLTALLLLGSLAALVLMLRVMPFLDETRFASTMPISEQYSSIMPPARAGATIRLATPFFNIYGVVALVGGALWSSYLFWRKRVLPNRVIGNLLIAAGALVISFASVLTRMGFGAWLYLSELLAAGLLFAGFLVAPGFGRDELTAASRSRPSAE